MIVRCSVSHMSFMRIERLNMNIETRKVTALEYLKGKADLKPNIFALFYMNTEKEDEKLIDLSVDKYHKKFSSENRAFLKNYLKAILKICKINYADYDKQKLEEKKTAWYINKICSYSVDISSFLFDMDFFELDHKAVDELMCDDLQPYNLIADYLYMEYMTIDSMTIEELAACDSFTNCVAFAVLGDYRTSILNSLKLVMEKDIKVLASG